jgi:hypothetical protein
MAPYTGNEYKLTEYDSEGKYVSQITAGNTQNNQTETLFTTITVFVSPPAVNIPQYIQ